MGPQRLNFHSDPVLLLFTISMENHSGSLVEDELHNWTISGLSLHSNRSVSGLPVSDCQYHSSELLGVATHTASNADVDAVCDMATVDAVCDMLFIATSLCITSPQSSGLLCPYRNFGDL